MADFTFKIGSRSYADWIRVAHEEGWDPSSQEHVEPQFAGAPAFVEGARWIHDAVGNKVWLVPLILKAASQDALYQLVRDINNELTQGARLEFQMPGASNPTFFDLERGKLEPEWQYWLTRANRVRCTLRLWTGAQGHSGTARPLASGLGTGMLTQLATGVLGDVVAKARAQIGMGSQPYGADYVAGWALHPTPSYPYRLTASYIVAVVSGGSMVGASGALASQYRNAGMPIGTFIDAFDVGLPAATLMEGRHRLLLIWRHKANLAGAVALRLQPNAQAPGYNATVIASANDGTAWQLSDLGEFPVQRQASQIQVSGKRVYASVASSAVTASPFLQIAGAILVPLDYGAGIAVDSGSGLLLNSNARNELRIDEFQVTVLTAASSIAGDVSDKHRGARPQIPPTGSPVASGPVSLFTFSGAAKDFRANDAHSAQWHVTERFKFLR